MSDGVSPVSQLLARSEALFTGRQLLVAGAMEDDYPLQLLQLAAAGTLFTTDYSYYHRHQGRGDLRFGHRLDGHPGQWDCLLLLLPKSKLEAQYLLAQLLPLLAPNATLLLAGDNRGGINGADKLLAPYCDHGRKLDSARRCSLYGAQLNKPVPPFEPEAWVQHYSLQLGDTHLHIEALPGVFSAGELDEGTRLLLTHLPPLDGRVLDLGCGAGVIGSVIKARYPAVTIELCDINALALESARRTLKRNGLEGRVYASDVYSDVAPGLSHIVTNPPFHAGLKTHYLPTEQMMQLAPDYLLPGGDLLLVANAFLKYAPFLERAFGSWQLVGEDRRFRLYLAR